MANYNSGGRLLVDSSFTSGVEVRVTSGQLSITSGLMGILSGQISVLSGQITAQLLSGSSWIGAVDSYYGGGIVPSPGSGVVTPIQSDSAGNVRVNVEGRKVTFASHTATVLVSGQTYDQFFLTYTGSGSAQKTIRLTRVSFSVLCQSGVSVPPIQALLCRRITLTNSGIAATYNDNGTTAMDPNDPAPTALFGYYSTMSGQVLGNRGSNSFMRAKIMAVAAASGAAAADGFEWKFPEGGGKQPTLRSSGSQIALELNFPFGGPTTATFPGSWAGGMEWTEEIENA